MKKKALVLIPCLNEESTLGLVINNIKKYLPKAGIVVYDNNSSDKTVNVAKKNWGSSKNGLREREGKCC
jgi:glycosyltransferase involved in cell wall biosynthesis